MNPRKMSFTARYVVAIGLLLLAANILLGVVTLSQSKSAMRSLIHKNMLDVANSAAGMMDGDVLSSLTESDVGGETFESIARTLTVFRENVDIHYIYTVKPAGNNRFTFVVDPDPEEPAAFGEEIVLTEALLSAGRGVAAVDDLPMADRWGNFYSVYSPVLDRKGNVAAIVGIDFDAEWFDEQVRTHMVSTTILTFFSVLIGGIVVFMITYRVRIRFKQLNASMLKLSMSVNQLMQEVNADTSHEINLEAEATPDEIDTLTLRIQAMQKDLGLYLDHLHRQAYTDALTNVGNSRAYHDRIQKLEEDISQGRASFAVGVFDVNSLKQINDHQGHEYGDLIINGAGIVLSEVFGIQNTYRIGGDEFAVIKGDINSSELSLVDIAVEAFNERHKDVTLAISKGVARYRLGNDMTFKEVFARADDTMYLDKKAYYETRGDRRRHS